MTIAGTAAPQEWASHALRLNGISKHYGRHVALDDVFLSIPRGQFVTLLGPSGSGKTSLLMAIAGFMAPTRGQIFLDDRDITDVPPERRNFGMVFQGYALFPNMTVEENVWFPLRVRGVSRGSAKERVRASLSMVQLDHLGDRYPSQLSGGQQQRVALARALVFEPSLLLLDEPMSALDRQLRAELQWELRSLHRRLGVTFVNVTHDQEEALSMSDEIVILRGGRIEQAGKPADLYDRPASAFVAGFLGDSNFIRGRTTATREGSFELTVGQATIVQSGSPHAVAGSHPPVLALRPEKLAVSRARPNLANALEGTIVDAKYQGSAYSVQVRSPDLGLLTARLAPNPAEPKPEVNASVWIGWGADDAVIVREN
ncbi:ABC transporter ATP-binding protein [Roseixanthobacter pseudopolyaromaticivorans]|uniref:ABC transporter ATP-binding protein n=1 Tax=Xanthobacteraceae TaxID=335928 RepID=UPI003728707A